MSPLTLEVASESARSLLPGRRNKGQDARSCDPVFTGSFSIATTHLHGERRRGIIILNKRSTILPMLEVRKELAALLAWDKAGFPCVTPTEVSAVGIRIVRMAELLRKARQIAAQN